MKFLKKFKESVCGTSKEVSLPGSKSSSELANLTEKEQEFIQNLSGFITKYQTDGPDKHLGEDHCEAISDFIGDNGAIFLVKRDGKAYYSANFSYPETAQPAQLERIFARMAMIVKEQIEATEGELVESRSVRDDVKELVEDAKGEENLLGNAGQLHELCIR